MIELDLTLLLSHLTGTSLDPANRVPPPLAAFVFVYGMLAFAVLVTSLLAMRVTRALRSWYRSVKEGMTAENQGRADFYLPSSHRIPQQVPHRTAEDSMDFPFFEEEGGPVGNEEEDLLS